MADETRLIGEIDDWVLHQACPDAGRWFAEGQVVSVAVAVNVAPQQLPGGGLVRTVAVALAAGGLPPALLVLEATEQGVLSEDGRCTRC